MRIPSGKTDQAIYFVAVDATDYVTRETGLATWTVQRSRNGAAEVAYTTPTITEIDAANMPGVYALLIDEDTTIASGSDSEEYCVHITHAGMAPVTRTIELYRRDTTSGRTLAVDSNSRADASVGAMAANVLTTAAIADGALTNSKFADACLTAAKFASGAFDAVWTVAARLLTAGTNIVLAKGTGVTGFNDLSAAQVNAEADTALADYDAPTNAEMVARTIAAASYATATAVDDLPTNAELATALAAADDSVLAQVALVKAKTDALPSDPADASVIAGRFDTLDTSIGDLPTNSEMATALGTADDAVLAQVALVKAKTDSLPSDPADHSLVIAATDAVIAAIGGLNNLSATGVRAALGMASANLDTQLADIPTNAELTAGLAGGDDAVLAQVALVKARTDLIPAAPAAVGDIPTAIQNADALLDRANGIETGLTLRGAQRLQTAALAGKVSGAGSGTEAFRNAVADSKDRLVVTVDQDGNRAAIVADAA